MYGVYRLRVWAQLLMHQLLPGRQLRDAQLWHLRKKERERQSECVCVCV